MLLLTSPCVATQHFYSDIPRPSAYLSSCSLLTFHLHILYLTSLPASHILHTSHIPHLSHFLHSAASCIMHTPRFPHSAHSRFHSTSLVRKERGHTSSLARCVVVGELSQRKQLGPVVLLVVAVGVEVLFEGLIDPLGLTIPFRMIS